ncbi:hypothetical protein KP509_20G086400 [Ceratopteris richardii]|uniref:Secreted protein n=1 Tax=Ceratopteris richardii TaxID=49495 RepID=A0A8T2SHS9_CERRI|nr:hypothetical protein KP509_20G086400 [Ceratopteris richardii]
MCVCVCICVCVCRCVCACVCVCVRVCMSYMGVFINVLSYSKCDCNSKFFSKCCFMLSPGMQSVLQI